LYKAPCSKSLQAKNKNKTVKNVQVIEARKSKDMETEGLSKNN
jgi:hypothetical protein